ncbi:MAG TPA: arginyltransferase [Gammaproteobacteria bacterium]|nr:arginyltransferase [Gammaproteobacteria bacterium]
MQDTQHDRLALYLSPEHPCSYLHGQSARSVFLDPQVTPQRALYNAFVAQGFRRSGSFLYRPQCEHCHACVPVRIPVGDFRPDRTQRRVWRMNQDLEARLRATEFDTGHFALYRRYLSTRHPGGGMDRHTPADYRAFLTSRWSDTTSVELRLADRLVAVAVMDELDEALSAVYTFYDPGLTRRSLGTFAILWQIEEARRRGLRWLYLGYWIAASRKMAYKDRFRPCERFGPDGWQPAQ